MTINDQIKDDKLQFDINEEAAKISALSLAKIGKYEYLTGEEILPSNSKQIIEPAKFKGKGKIFEKKIKTTEDQGEKSWCFKRFKTKRSKKSIKGIFSKDHESDEIKNEMHRIKWHENKVTRDNLLYESSKQVYDFKVFKSKRSFGVSIYNHKIEIQQDNQEQVDLLEYI